MPTTVITSNDKALDAEVQITTATGANDSKWLSPLKLFNWFKWLFAQVLAFTNITDSTSNTTGAVTVAGGMGVAKRLFAKTLASTDMIGTGARIVSTDALGNLSAPFTIVAPTVTDTVLQSYIAGETNWKDDGTYTATGNGLANIVQGQFYKASNKTDWFYFMYDSTTPMRIPMGGQMHLRGLSSTPSASAGAAIPNATNLTVNGHDFGMFVSFLTGATTVANSTVVTITFNKAYTNGIKSVLLQGANAASASIWSSLYITAAGTLSFNIAIAGQLSPNTTYNLYAAIIS